MQRLTLSLCCRPSAQFLPLRRKGNLGAMDWWTPYLVMRSTWCDRRDFGARLDCDGEEDEEGYGVMQLAEGDDVWEQAGCMISDAFGDKAWGRLKPEGSCASADSVARRCVYALEAGAWREDHPQLNCMVYVHHRQPQSVPEADCWLATGLLGVKTAIYEDQVWYVLKMREEDTYLIIHKAIADKSLCEAALC